MPDINSSADLTSILSDWETRLRKLERQVAVPRTDSAATAAEKSTSSTSNFLTGETVTLVTTPGCLLHFYIEVTAKYVSGAGGDGYVSLRDDETGQLTDIFFFNSSTYITYATASGAYWGGSSLIWPDYGRVEQIAGVSGRRIVGGVTTIVPDSSWASQSGPHTFSLGMRTNSASGTVSTKDRKLFAWVQTF